MFTPDETAEGNSLYEARKAMGLGLNEVSRMTGIPRSTFKVYERGLSRPGIYWDKLVETFGEEAMESFIDVPTEDDNWMMYRHILARDYAAKQATSGAAPKSIEEWRIYLGYTPEQMCALFNICRLTWVKWRQGKIARHYLELIKRLFGEVRV